MAVEDQEYQALLDKLDEVTLKCKHLSRLNSNKDKTIRHLKRIIKRLKEDAGKGRKKQHYKNSRRGSRFNG